MRSLKRITSVTLSAALVAGLVQGPFITSYAAENVEKEETVYVNQTASGDIEKIIVSDWLKNVSGTGEIKDKSDLEDIKNVKGDETFKDDNGELTWKANDADIYYQGTTTKKPPVGVNVSFKLDGKDIKAEELAGKSGNLEITLHYYNETNYEDKIDGVSTELKSPFLMASTVILPVDGFSDVEVSQGKVVSEGSNQILLAYGVPGLLDSLKLADDTRKKLEDDLSDTVTITAKVKDFELGSIYTVATSDDLTSVDLDENSDMDELEDAISQLEDASEELVSGSSDLSDGVKTLQDKFKEYSSGVTKVNKGAASLSKGAKSLSDGITKYTDGVKSITDGTKDYVKGTGSLTSGIKQYVAGEKQIDAGAKELNEGSKSFPEQYNEFSKGLKQYTDGVDSVAANMKALSEGADELYKGVDAAVTGVKDTNQGMTEALQKLGGNAAGYERAITELATMLQTDETLTDEQKSSLQGIIGELTQTATNEKAILQGIQSSSDPNAIKQLDGLVGGAKKLSESASALSSGAGQLSDKSATLISGSANVSAGITKVVGGISSLYDGIKKLSENNDTLTTGADTLEKSGNLLTSGIGQLTSSTDSLTSGAVKLSKGAKSLSSGTASLDTATDKVYDGIGKISDGTDKLSDGMSQFKSKGTDKLKNEYNDKVKTVLDRFDSLTGDAGRYNSFSGLADGMNGKVKFIFQTAEIKTKD